MNERVKELSSRPYRVIVKYEPDGNGTPDYLAWNPEFGDTCIAQGSTPDEALADLEQARALTIEYLLDEGLPVPDPEPWPGVMVTDGYTPVPAASTLFMSVPSARMVMV